MPRPLEELLEEARELEIPDAESKVLIIDDEESVLLVLEQVIGKSGYQVATEASGLAAIEQLKKPDDPPRVVLVDKNLHDTTGMEVIRAGKQAHPDTEFIMITGYASMKSVQEAMDLGAFGYLEKPFHEIKLVVRSVRAAMAKNHAAAQNALLLTRLRESYKELYEAKVKADTIHRTTAPKNAE